jgi:hypothetical protein
MRATLLASATAVSLNLYLTVFINLPGDEMALLIELVVDLGVN